MSLPRLLPEASISYTRTFLSQLDTARISELGLNARSLMVSSGGSVRATSLLRSPWVLVLLAAAELAAEPKRDMTNVGRAFLVLIKKMMRLLEASIASAAEGEV